MGSVFLSYKRQDVVRARQLRNVLRTNGFNVWWDEDVQGGEHWAPAIDEAIMGCSSVVVLWSNLSITAEWVKHEATIGKARKILVPVRVDDCQVPRPFDHINAINLTEWDGDHVTIEIFDLLRTLRRKSRRAVAVKAAKIFAVLVAILVGSALGYLFTGARAECPKCEGSPVVLPVPVVVAHERLDDPSCGGTEVRQQCLDVYTENNNVIALQKLCTEDHVDIACWNVGVTFSKKSGVSDQWSQALKYFSMACQFDDDVQAGVHGDVRYQAVCSALKSEADLRALFASQHSD